MEGSELHTIASCQRMARGGEHPAKARAMIPRKKKRAREYMANPVVDDQPHDSVEFTPPSSAKVSRSYEACFMIGSKSMRSIHC